MTNHLHFLDKAICMFGVLNKFVGVQHQESRLDTAISTFLLHLLELKIYQEKKALTKWSGSKLSSCGFGQ